MSGGPHLHVSPTSLTFAGSGSQAIAVTNSGTSVVLTVSISSDAAWLTTNISSVVTSGVVSVSVDPTGLAGGIHTGHLTFVSDLSGGTVIVPVTVVVGFAFVNRVWGESPVVGDGLSLADGTTYSQNLNVVSGGDWRITCDDWLSVTPSSGSGNGVVTVNLYKLGQSSLPQSTGAVQRVKPGQYSGTVTITPASGSAVDVSVNFKVGYGDQLG